VTKIMCNTSPQSKTVARIMEKRSLYPVSFVQKVLCNLTINIENW
jgi:hypothetical protein